MNSENQSFTPMWQKFSSTVKALIIGVLTLALLIPSIFVQNLIDERQNRNQQVLDDITNQWSGSQLINGPVLVIPYRSYEKYTDTAKQVNVRETIGKLYILPEHLNYKAATKSQKLHKGIFYAAVYNANVNVNGDFGKIDLTGMQISPAQLLPERAYLLFGISDTKGLKSLPEINFSGQKITTRPAFNDTLFENTMQAAFNATGLLEKSGKFNYTLQIKGSNELRFLTLGKATTAQISGNWASPLFDGSVAADSRKIDTSGFIAKWHTLNLGQTFPQQWVNVDNVFGNKQKVSESSFGVKMTIPVDDYQKTMRSSKYAILIILLTFVALFLTEIITRAPIHTFNYLLVGAAMVVFYILLLSFAEQMGFNFSYAIAAVATVGLISWFIASLLKNGKVAGLLTFILSIFYLFVFVIIQLEDLALLVGSVTLFVIIAILMYFSRKINWDNQ